VEGVLSGRRGDPPLAPVGATPVRGTRRGRRAPARGVDVKETPRGAQKGPKRPFSGKYRQKAGFWLFLLKMPIFSYFSRFLPGSYRAKKGPKAEKRLKSSKPAKSPDPAPGAGVVLHQPLAAGPCTRFWRGLEKGLKTPVLAGKGSGPRKGPFWVSRGPRSPDLPAGRRAPARGVDVKPPSAETPSRVGTCPGPVPWAPRPGGDPQTPSGRFPDPGPGVPGPGEGPGGLSQAPGRPAAAPPGVVLHQPLAAGPCPRPGPTPAPARRPPTGRRVRGGLARRAAWV